MCGEKIGHTSTSSASKGSPPHVRGKVQPVQLVHDALGITPACAGKRPRTPLVGSFSRDHPRMCGEKLIVAVPLQITAGSPPHVRGKAQLPAAPCPASRITPACAGKSFGEKVLQSGVEDHPRMCGEKRSAFGMQIIWIGSPPHVRGKVRNEGLRNTKTGITPACAGKSLRGGQSVSVCRDHPRMCGEKM